MTLRELLDDARRDLAQARDMLCAAQGAHSRAATALERAVKDGLKAPSSLPDAGCEHLRGHRPGRPSRIDTDRDLRNFVLARIDQMGFVDLANQIADYFPPDRRVGKSALHAWFRKHNPKPHPR